MSNDGTGWHSDDELASALERSLEVTTQSNEVQAGSLEVAPTTAANDFSDLFAALSEPERVDAVESAEPSESVAVFEPVPSFEPIAVPRSEEKLERVYESLNDFLPQVVAINEAAQTTIVDEPVTEVFASVPVTSAHITQPIRWDRQRPTFDEIIFGTTSPEAN
jgi:hypothetical protein